MITLLLADIHLNDEPRDEYRWGLFQWLAQQEWDELFILGDLTDKKDKHSAILVNRLVDSIALLASPRRTIHIIKGNHDCIDANTPFFRFLGHLPDVHYFTHHYEGFVVAGRVRKSIAILPFEPAITNSWEQPGFPKAADIALLHGTVTGCVVENGSRLTGIPKEALAGFGKVWAGDIHVPQKLGNVEYVGAPYHVHFGDKFIPRIVRLRDWEYECDLHYPTPKKELVTISREEDFEKLRAFTKGDTVKLRIILPYQIAHEWRIYKNKAARICEETGATIDGVELVTDKSVIPTATLTAQGFMLDEEALAKFSEIEKLDRETASVGMGLLKSAQGK